MRPTTWQLKCIVAIALVLPCVTTNSQTLTVRLLNAKNGKPMVGKNVTVQWSLADQHGHVVSIDKHGYGKILIPADAVNLTLQSGPKNGKDPYRIPYLNCNEGPTIDLPIARILSEGLVITNTCSHKTEAAVPGQITVWGQPIPRWMPDFQ